MSSFGGGGEGWAGRVRRSVAPISIPQGLNEQPEGDDGRGGEGSEEVEPRGGRMALVITYQADAEGDAENVGNPHVQQEKRADSEAQAGLVTEGIGQVISCRECG